ncbi:HD domain-containing protein [Culicoidibacter larvae]|uniref:HD domain-containing protein n=1 Tax=Culicoidibacter larvae TaxID=2579976 RepID=A0A5R8QBG5_9FIRM|nr:HD domain-containing protein [Culicoidibacter larvae]TLG73919.1 HD domain-containing protein [Culicoidibacter larvae]
MTTYLTDAKVFRDPIHNYILVNEPLIWKLINTYEFQRLHHIHQLGGTFQAFHGAEHTRFGHSLGVYEIVRQILEKVEPIAELLDEREQLLVFSAALLHDVGHGPFSHALESIIGFSHEDMSKKVIMDPDSEVHQLLTSEMDEAFADEVEAIIAKRHPNQILVELISGQVDADRMDYLARDAYFAGVPYGNYDMTRIMRVMRVANGHIVFKESGIHALENYIMSRYHMYVQVYNHPAGRAYEFLLEKIVQRLVLLREQDELSFDYPLLFELYDQKASMPVSRYIQFDEHVMFYYIRMCLNETDILLQDLANRFLRRQLLKYVDVSKEEAEQFEMLFAKASADKQMYAAIEKLENQAFSGTGDETITIETRNGELVPLTEVSLVMGALQEQTYAAEYRIFYYPEIIDATKKVTSADKILAWLG